MFNSKISLDQFTHTLIETINTANARIQTGYISAVQQRDEDFFAAPPPLTVKNAKISFTAQLSKQDRQHGEALMLDFSKQAGNFHGELVLDALGRTDEEAQPNEDEPPVDMPAMQNDPVQELPPMQPMQNNVLHGQGIPPCATLFTPQPPIN